MIILAVAICVTIAALIIYRQHRREMRDEQLAAQGDG